MSLIRVAERIKYLSNLKTRRVGKDEIDRLAKLIVYGGRETYEFHKENKYKINVEKYTVEVLDKGLAREQRDLKKKSYTEKAVRKKLQECMKKQERGREHAV